MYKQILFYFLLHVCSACEIYLKLNTCTTCDTYFMKQYYTPLILNSFFVCYVTGLEFKFNMLVDHFPLYYYMSSLVACYNFLYCYWMPAVCKSWKFMKSLRGIVKSFIVVNNFLGQCTSHIWICPHLHVQYLQFCIQISHIRMCIQCQCCW